MRNWCRRAAGRRGRAYAAAVAIGLAVVAGCSSEPAPRPPSPPPAPPSSTEPAPPPTPEPTPNPQGAGPTGPIRTPDDLAAFVAGGAKSAKQGSFGLDRARLVADPTAPGGRLVRVSFPRGSASPQAARDSGGPEGGTQAYVRLPRPVDAVTLTYFVRFPAGFQFVKGGKLPGLFGGTGGSGGEHRDDGFSTRLMWRSKGAGEVYAYVPGGSGYGDSWGRGSWTFAPGRWTKVAQRVMLNAPGRSDGSVTMWVDDRQVFQKTDVEFRSSAELRIDGVFFSTFFGGSDTSWASPVDQSIDFAGFALGQPAP